MQIPFFIAFVFLISHSLYSHQSQLFFCSFLLSFFLLQLQLTLSFCFFVSLTLYLILHVSNSFMLLCPSLQYPFFFYNQFSFLFNILFYCPFLKITVFFTSTIPLHLLDCHFFFLYRYQYLPPSSIMFLSLSNSFDIHEKL